MKLFTPSEIPLSYFYFGYKKAKHYVLRETSFCDYLDLENFERDLDQNIKSIQEDFKNYNEEGSINKLDRYKLQPAILYWYPKSWDEDRNPRLRPKALFKFRDQVAWATVVLALSEWFDTNPSMKDVISLEDKGKRRSLEWMVSWSFNNRLKRIHQYDYEKKEFQRGYIHYNGSSLYESYQWGLRQLNSQMKQAFLKIIEKYGEAYQGKADIQEFYPTLNKEYIKKMFEKRLNTLVENGVLKNKEGWLHLLADLLNYKFECPDIEILKGYKQTGKSFFLQYAEKIMRNKKDDLNEENALEKITEYLNNTLPLELIASGFLSNCVLTEYLDNPVKEFIEENKKIETYIFRYTDDITIISSDGEFIKKIIGKVRERLNNIGLSLSKEKTIPTNENEIDEMIKEKIQKNSSLKQIVIEKGLLDAIKNGYEKSKLEPIRITKNDTIPGSTAMIEKLSQVSEIQLQSMDNEELEQFIYEMLHLLDVQFDSKEIKDETKVAFASWRIKSGLKEALNRALNIEKYSPEASLQRAFKRYPYKISLYEIYTIFLIDCIIKGNNRKSYFEVLENFLRSLKLSIQENWDSFYGPFIRTKVLFAFSNEWRRIPTSYRERLRDIISDAVQAWYDSQEILWFEKYAIYWCFSICQIRTNPKLNIDCYKVFRAIYSSLEYLQKIYLLSNDFYYHLVEKEKENDSVHQIDNISDDVLYYLSKLFYKGLYYNYKNHKLEFSVFEEMWYQSIWDLITNIKKEQDSSLQFDKLISKYQIWVSWARINSAKLPEKGLDFIAKYPIEVNELSKKVMIDVLSILNKLIKFYFQKPKDAAVFFNWINKRLEKSSTTDNVFLHYLLDRFRNFSRIQANMAIDGSLAIKMPDFVSDFNDKKKNFEVLIPLHDWIFYINNTNYNDAVNYLRPLSEYEIVTILKRLFFEGKSEEIKNSIHLLTKGITIENWKKFRQWEGGNNKYNLEFLDEFVVGLTSENQELNKLFCYPAYDIITSDFSNEETKNQGENYIISMTLFSMLKGNAIDSSYLKPFYIYSWKDLQTYFNQANFPSTTIASLLVNTLNYHRKFYESYYDVYDQSSLPYRKLGDKPIDGRKSYQRIVETYLKEAEKNLLYWKNGVIEVIEIDVDVIMRDGEEV
ncbi:reverse transcriptase domain-containing protein [Aeribacillus pallidus]